MLTLIEFVCNKFMDVFFIYFKRIDNNVIEYISFFWKMVWDIFSNNISWYLLNDHWCLRLNKAVIIFYTKIFYAQLS